MKKPALLCLLACAWLLWPPASRAIELSLEENRAQRGNIGYVDMQRIFKLFPETIRAKENFDEVVRQAEEQVNLRKAEIIRTRFEIADLRIQREALAKAAPPAPVPAPVAPPAKPQPALDVLLSTQTPAPFVAPSSASLIVNLPGVTTGAALNNSSAKTATAAPNIPPAPAAAAAPPASAPGPVGEIDEKIAQKTKDLAQKESDFKAYQAEAERNLLDLESRRTEILLGKIQKTVKEIAHREGVSVVVDKQSILFGHDAVDLTDKVLKALSTKGT